MKKNMLLKLRCYSVFIMMDVLLGACSSEAKHMNQLKDSVVGAKASAAKNDSAFLAQKNEASGYESYCNGRYRYCVDYPTILKPEPEAGNGDGRVFLNNLDSATLTVYGTRGVDPETEHVLSLSERYVLDKASVGATGQITYDKLAKTFYVFSGYRNDRIFYQKTIAAQDEISGDPSFAYAILEYPVAKKEVYDKVSKRIFESFK